MYALLAGSEDAGLFKKSLKTTKGRVFALPLQRALKRRVYMKNMEKLILIAALLASCALPVTAEAVVTETYNFYGVTTNDPSGDSIIAGQNSLFVDVSSPFGSQ